MYTEEYLLPIYVCLFRPRCQRAHLMLCKFQYIILSLIFNPNCVWANQDWAKLFARVIGHKITRVEDIPV